MWFLILSTMLYPPAVALTQVGPFTSEQACVEAGEKAKKHFTAVSYVCVSASAQTPPTANQR